MSKEIKRQLSKIELIEKKLFWFLSVFLFILFVSYGIFVNKAILNGRYSQNFNSSVASLSEELNSLEFKYLESKNNITLDLAVAKGFKPVESQKFVERGVLENTLSLITNEK
jgi:hypothetical protein